MTIKMEGDHAQKAVREIRAWVECAVVRTPLSPANSYCLLKQTPLLPVCIQYLGPKDMIATQLPHVAWSDKVGLQKRN